MRSVSQFSQQDAALWGGAVKVAAQFFKDDEPTHRLPQVSETKLFLRNKMKRAVAD